MRGEETVFFIFDGRMDESAFQDLQIPSCIDGFDGTDLHTEFFNVSSEESEARWFHQCGGPWRRRHFVISMYHETPYCKDIVDAWYWPWLRHLLHEVSPELELECMKLWQLESEELDSGGLESGESRELELELEELDSGELDSEESVELDSGSWTRRSRGSWTRRSQGSWT